MEKLRNKMAAFMVGRYGADDLGKFTIYASMAMLLLNILFRKSIFFWLALVLLGVSYVRMFSKNHAKRYEENRKYCELRYKLVCKFQELRRPKAGADFKIYSCPNCKQKVRVPKKKGKIEIRCPKCGTTFIRRT